MAALPFLLVLSTTQSPDARFEAKLRELFAASQAPGVAASFVRPDGKVHTVVAGLADRERNLPMRPRHRLLAGSVGKTFFAAAILRVWDEGRVDLDRPVARVLGKEAWFGRLPNARTLTLRNLMTHTSGIPEHVQLPAFTDRLKQQPDRVWTPPELLAYVEDVKPLFEAGKGWAYADTNFILAAYAVEKETGLQLYGEIERRFLKPLRLQDTLPSVKPRIAAMATGYAGPGNPFAAEGPVFHNDRLDINPQFEWAGGGFYSTSGDLARWAHELYAGKALSSRARKAMIDAQTPAKTGRDHRYGLGVQVRPSPMGAGHGHGGWYPGYLTEMEYFPEHRLAVAIQFNTDDMRKLGQPPRAWLIKLAEAVK
ncbi:MAG: serine hydrolase domain-containing protein [Fimbriimonas sp.]